MYLQRLLQINMATMAALGTLLLGMGQREAGLPILMLFAAITSVLLTDVTGWFRLNRTVANIAAFGALLISARELLQFGHEDQVTGIIRLLIYVQIILLFQEKDDRTYWQLVMLSLLQVVLAAAYSQGVGFGVLLIVYMLVGFSALTLLCLHRQRYRFEQSRTTLFSSTGFTGTGFTGTGGGDLDRIDPAEIGIGWMLVRRLAAMGFGTLMLTLVLFVVFPRSTQSEWRAAIVAQRHLVGFSEEVQLGELGEIIESPEEVMRIKLTRSESNRPCRVLGELYLRGAILTEYHDGLWRHRRSGNPIQPLPSVRPAPGERWVRQTITIEPLDRREVFCVWPFFETENSRPLGLSNDRLTRPRRRQSIRFSFELGTTGLGKGEQSVLVPCDDSLEAASLLQVRELPELVRLAQQWASASELPGTDRYGMANEFVRQFGDPENMFQYTLEGQERNLNVDPIEDFVTEHRQGHCEYYATALALMLRSQGIPARVVVGYKCGEYDPTEKFYQVRQLHAHTWVEAYLRPEDLPAKMVRDDPPSRWARGAWLRLDATPAGDDILFADRGMSLLDHAKQTIRGVQSFWAAYVLEMNSRRQNEMIYQPVIQAIKRAAAAVVDPAWWGGLLGRIVRLLDPSRLTGPTDYRLWLGILILASLAMLLRRGKRLIIAGLALFSRLFGRATRQAARRRAEVEFYRRLETVLLRHGLERPTGQTQREFALFAGQNLAERTGLAELAPLAAEVTEAFYRVRFGRLPLDTAQAQTVERALAKLAACQQPAAGK